MRAACHVGTGDSAFDAAFPRTSTVSAAAVSRSAAETGAGQPTVYTAIHFAQGDATMAGAGSANDWESFRSSQTMRIIVVVVLVLVLQVPVSVIGGLIAERRARRDQAVAEVSDKWGTAQTITGPVLVVPYTVRSSETAEKGRKVVRTVSRRAVFLPGRLSIRATLDSHTRRRGIYAIPVYRMDAAIEGEFAAPRFADIGIQPQSVAWDKAEMAIGISDVRAIQLGCQVTWESARLAFRPGTGSFSGANAGIHALVSVPQGRRSIPFSLDLRLNGSIGAYFVPVGETTNVDLRSNHPSPSFQGGWLPGRRNVGGSGFSARWSIPSLGRNYGQAWDASSDMQSLLDRSRFGVDLIEAVDEYHMAERSTKYASLFIALTFAAIWLTEVLAGLRVHPIQYLMLGAALCLFYLLELSLSEHVGFHRAYTLASCAVVLMLAANCATVLRRLSRAGRVGLEAVALYAFLYVLLTNEDYALLIGSMGLFAILALAMFLTRKVDWYAVGPAQPRVVDVPEADTRPRGS